MSRLLTIAGALFVALPSVALAATSDGADEAEFDPAHEWELKTWIDLPFGMDINKAVAYLILGTIVTCILGIVLMRVKAGRDPTGGRRSARSSTRWRRCRSPSRVCRRRRSAAGSRTSPR